MNKKNNRKGFTTVELVIVIAVIAILATALIPTFGGLINSANETADMQAARQYYNDYLLENAETATTDTFYIHSGSHYYKVTNGAFSTDDVPAPADVDNTPVKCVEPCTTHATEAPATGN